MSKQRMARIAELAEVDVETTAMILFLEAPAGTGLTQSFDRYTDEEIARYVADMYSEWC